MFKDMRSPEKIAENERRYAEQRRETERLQKLRAKLEAKVWSVGVPWQPIDTCPFKAYEYSTIFVTDGKARALVEVHTRFGTPMRWKKQPEMVMTDHGFALMGGEVEEIEAPKWWFEWELEDVNGSMTYAGGEETGREEVGFIATHWLPLPPAKVTTPK